MVTPRGYSPLPGSSDAIEHRQPPPPLISIEPAMEESLSIEETNKLRISLGLKPLKVEPESRPSGGLAGEETYDNSVEGHERRAVDNWKQREAEIEKEAARKTKLDGIKKARDVAKRFAKLEGRGLGEEDENEEDTTTWVRKMKKRQKKMAEKMAKEREEELERAVREQKEYTADQLAGVRVGHDLEQLHEGEEGTILTLKDSTIEENEGIFSLVSINFEFPLF